MQTAEKISITLPPDMLRLIREAVDGGEYASTSEALRDAVRAWHRQRLEDAERLVSIIHAQPGACHIFRYSQTGSKSAPIHSDHVTGSQRDYLRVVILGSEVDALVEVSRVCGLDADYQRAGSCCFISRYERKRFDC